MEKNKNKTTIEFDRDILVKLDALKVDPREPYVRVILRLMRDAGVDI